MTERPIEEGAAFQDVNLAIRDRINYPYILGNQLLKIEQLQIDAPEKVPQAIELMVHMIPDDYKDQSFLDEIAAGTVEVLEDIRPFVVPRVRLDKDVCIELGIPCERKIIRRDPMVALQACMNLLGRLQMLTRKRYQEIRPGDEWDDSWFTEEEVQPSTQGEEKTEA